MCNSFFISHYKSRYQAVKGKTDEFNTMGNMVNSITIIWVINMPRKPKKPCAYPGCPELVQDGRFCLKHKRQDQRRQDKERGTAAQRGYGYRWQKYTKVFLGEHPLCECEECKKLGRLLPATVVDHIIPHKGDYNLFWDPDNHQAMAKRCHDRKTATEDGGFGRK